MATTTKTAKLDPTTLASGLSSMLQAALSAEKPIAQADQQKIAALATALAPIATAELAEMVTSTDPTVQQNYLAGLAGVIAAKAAELGLDAAYQQPAIIAGVLSTWATKLSTAIKDPTVQLIVKAALAAIPLAL